MSLLDFATANLTHESRALNQSALSPWIYSVIPVPVMNLSVLSIYH